MLFVLTTGRSGSKSIAQYLSGSPDLVCLHEPEPVLIAEATQYIAGKFPHKRMVELLVETRPETMDGKQYGESNQKLSFVVPALREAFPDARYVWLVRDGREVVDSTFSLGWYDPEMMQDSVWQRNLVEGPMVGDVAAEDWEAMGPFARCCWYWSFTNRLIERELGGMGPGSWIRVRIEDRDFGPVFDLAGARAASGGMPWINRKKKSREDDGWRRWDGVRRAEFERLCGGAMDRVYPEWRVGVRWREVGKRGLARRLHDGVQQRLANASGSRHPLWRALRWPVRRFLPADNPLDRLYRRLSGME